MYLIYSNEDNMVFEHDARILMISRQALIDNSEQIGVYLNELHDSARIMNNSIYGSLVRNTLIEIALGENND